MYELDLTFENTSLLRNITLRTFHIDILVSDQCLGNIRMECFAYVATNFKATDAQHLTEEIDNFIRFKVQAVAVFFYIN